MQSGIFVALLEKCTITTSAPRGLHNPQQSPRQRLPRQHGTVSLSCALLFLLVVPKGRRHRQICVNLLVLHLCVADLLVTAFGLGANAIWMLTVSWNGGNLLCKLVKYFEACGLYSSAFIVTVISIDRCLAVIDPLALGAANRRTKIMITVVWSMAFVFSIPQVSSLLTFSSRADLFGF